MNNKSTLIAIVCGLLTALMLFAPLRLGMFGAIILLLSVLPIFVSTLGFGTLAGLISAVIAGLVFAFAFGPLAALASFTLTLLPAVWAGHMAGLVREEDGESEWFPLATILFRLALLSAALVIVLGLIGGFNAATLPPAIEKLYSDIFANMAAQNPQVALPSKANIQILAEQGARFMPVLMPVSLLLTHVINLYLGGSIVRKRNWLLRPKDDIAATLGLPMEAVAVFGLALLVSFLGGNLGLIAKIFAGAMGSAFVLVGLAVVHFLLRGSPMRFAILFLCYAATLFTVLPAFFLAVLGLAETLIGIRAKRAPTPNNKI